MNNQIMPMAQRKPVRHVVLFSGGFDSTYTLYKLADAKKRAVSMKCDTADVFIQINWDDRLWHDDSRVYADDSIVALSISNNGCGGTPAKLEKESHARRDILKHMTDMFRGVVDISTISVTNIIDIKPKIYDDEACFNSGIGGLYQPLTWAFAMMPLLHENDHVYFSYITGDQAPIFRQQIERIIYDSGVIMGLNNPISVHFPLKFMKKDDILCKLYCSAGKEIFEDAVSCESECFNPKFCGKCIPCTHLKEALLRLAITGEAFAFAAEYLDKYFNIALSDTDNIRHMLSGGKQIRKGNGCNEKERDQKDSSQSSEVNTKEGCDYTAG